MPERNIGCGYLLNKFLNKLGISDSDLKTMFGNEVDLRQGLSLWLLSLTEEKTFIDSNLELSNQVEKPKTESN